MSQFEMIRKSFPFRFCNSIIVTLRQFKIAEQLNIAEIDVQDMVANKPFAVAFRTVASRFENIAQHIDELNRCNIQEGFHCWNKDLWQHIFPAGKCAARDAACNRILNSIQLHISHDLRNTAHYKAAIGQNTCALASCTCCRCKTIENTVRAGTTTTTHDLAFSRADLLTLLATSTIGIAQHTQIAQQGFSGAPFWSNLFPFIHHYAINWCPLDNARLQAFNIQRLPFRSKNSVRFGLA